MKGEQCARLVRGFPYEVWVLRAIVNQKGQEQKDSKGAGRAAEGDAHAAPGAAICHGRSAAVEPTAGQAPGPVIIEIPPVQSRSFSPATARPAMRRAAISLIWPRPAALAQAAAARSTGAWAARDDSGAGNSRWGWGGAAAAAVGAAACVAAAAAAAPAAHGEPFADEPRRSEAQLRAEFLDWLRQQGGRADGVALASSRQVWGAWHHRLLC